MTLPAHFPTLTAPTGEPNPKTPSCPIRPLGEQIIIRTIPQQKVGSIIIPESAKRISYQGSVKGAPSDELQYVNRRLFEQMTETLRMIVAGVPMDDSDLEWLGDLHKRAQKQVLPRAAKAIPNTSGEAINFVEAEVMEIGPGKRSKSDQKLLGELAHMLELSINHMLRYDHGLKMLERVSNSSDTRVPFLVKPGDHILYHPAVQRFDREITHLMDDEPERRWFIIREESVLAVIERAITETEVRG
jgi:co-chaperonin GroES (HSP10)